jgi:hypothetical protein
LMGAWQLKAALCWQRWRPSALISSSRCPVPLPPSALRPPPSALRPPPSLFTPLLSLPVSLTAVSTRGSQDDGGAHRGHRQGHYDRLLRLRSFCRHTSSVSSLSFAARVRAFAPALALALLPPLSFSGSPALFPSPPDGSPGHYAGVAVRNHRLFVTLHVCLSVSLMRTCVLVGGASDPDRPTRAAQIEVLHQCSHPQVPKP